MAADPADKPVRIPDPDPTDATPGEPEVQYPPGVPSDKAVTPPTQIPVMPEITVGSGATVTENVALQPIPVE